MRFERHEELNMNKKFMDNFNLKFYKINRTTTALDCSLEHTSNMDKKYYTVSFYNNGIIILCRRHFVKLGVLRNLNNDWANCKICDMPHFTIKLTYNIYKTLNFTQHTPKTISHILHTF